MWRHATLIGVITTELAQSVDRIIRDVVAEQVLPRFGHLTAGDISEKAPDDLVTVADRAAEAALTAQLTDLLPDSVVVGEEAVSGDPNILALVDGTAQVWIVDPIDGTHNFATNNARFSTLVALCESGQTVASWTYVPVFDTMATAIAGGGAHLDGKQIHVRTQTPDLRFLDVIAPHPKWWAADRIAQFNALGRAGVSLNFYDAGGLEYIELAAGRRAAMVVTWENPWDHAAGLLLHAEAGGVTKTLDGSAFRLSGGNTLPFVVAPNAAIADLLCDVLANP